MARHDVKRHNVSSYLLEQFFVVCTLLKVSREEVHLFWSRVSVCPLDSSCLVHDWCWCLMVRVWLITSVIVQFVYPWCQGPIGLIAPLPWIRAFFSVICPWRSEFKGHNPSCSALGGGWQEELSHLFSLFTHYIQSKWKYIHACTRT